MQPSDITATAARMARTMNFFKCDHLSYDFAERLRTIGIKQFPAIRHYFL